MKTPPQSTMVMEMDFIIKVSHPDFDFKRLRSELYGNVERFTDVRGLWNDNRYQFNESPIQVAIKRLLTFSQRSDEEKDMEKRLFVADYKETDGSFIIAFTIVAIGAFINYGSIRQSVDYFKTDVEALISNLSPEGARVSMNSSLRGDGTLVQTFDNVNVERIVRKVRIYLSVTLLAAVLAVGIAGYALYESENHGTSSSTESIRDAVRTEMDRVNEQRTSEELVRLLQDIKLDTAKVTKLKSKISIH